MKLNVESDLRVGGINFFGGWGGGGGHGGTKIIGYL